MPDYYNVTLSAARLKKCYDIAPSRVRQYLQAEVDFVLQKITRKDIVLELGCGYGRLIPMLARKARFVHGIDSSVTSLKYGLEFLKDTPRHMLQMMDAGKLTFSANTMDIVCCLQNGIASFGTDQRKLIKEAVRVTKPGGCAIFSTFSEKFWDHRLKWFMLQSKAGLIGELDPEKTKNGHIVSRDGFTASTINPRKFIELTRWIRGIKVNVKEVDDSCLFFLIKKMK